MSNHVFFRLYTRHTNNTPENLYVDDISNLRRSHFDPKKPTKIVTHGWMSSCQNAVCTRIRDAFLKNGDYNIITINWSSISKLTYVRAIGYTVPIAKYVARMLDFLGSQGLHASNVTIVGHSIGAHIAALASYYAKNKVYYVVGLDPAAPLYNFFGQKSKLMKGFAEYVEVIHTTKDLGEYNPVGDSDFYPNGGLVQSGCGIDLGESCSHSRSHEYFAESINSDRFLARKCSSYIDYVFGNCKLNAVAHMGGVTPDFRVKGKYYLYTNPKPPYAKG
ncbi:pancreatic lipase-related protein 2-like isoform X2 [Megachile rotundata]